MRLRWPRFLPGFPAILLSIVVLGFWVALTVSPLIHPTEALIHFPENEFFILVPRDGLGFPLIFVETEWRSLPKGPLKIKSSVLSAMHTFPGALGSWSSDG